MSWPARFLCQLWILTSELVSLCKTNLAIKRKKSISVKSVNRTGYLPMGELREKKSTGQDSYWLWNRFSVNVNFQPVHYSVVSLFFYSCYISFLYWCISSSKHDKSIRKNECYIFNECRKYLRQINFDSVFLKRKWTSGKYML